MKKLMTLMGLAALSFSAFALTTNKVGFEKDESYKEDEAVATKTESIVGTTDAKLWYGASDDASVVKTYGEDVSKYNYTTTSLVADGPGDQFLSVEASSAPLVRSLADYDGYDQPQAQPLTGDVVADTLVQFTASEEMQTVDATDGTKFALWLYADPEGATNLYVTAGSYSVESDTESVDAANFKLNATVLPGEWHRVTIRAIKDIRNIGGEDDGLGFVVYIDGTPAVCSDSTYESQMGEFLGTLSTEAQILKDGKKLFLSLVNDGNDVNKLTGVGFKGTGYVDDLSIVDGNNVPDFVAPATGFVLSWDAGVVSFTIAGTTYETANLAKDYLIVQPTAGSVVIENVAYANGYGAGTWTATGADVEGTTFTLNAGAAEGTIVSSRATFMWNGNDYATLSEVFKAMDGAGSDAPALIQLVRSFNVSTEDIDGGFLEYDVPDGAVLDLYGQTITDDRGEGDALFYVAGDFTIIDSVGGGKLVSAAEAEIDLFDCASGNLVIGQVDEDEGATVEGPVAGATLVRGFFTDTTGATTAQGSVCSEETDQDGYWVVAPGEAPEPTYTFTILTIAHTTYTYTVDGDSEAQLTGLTNGTKVVVTYAAAPGYKFTAATADAAVKAYTINGDDGETDQVVEVEASPYAGTDYAPWAYSSGVILWRGTQNDFHASTVADVAADGTVGDAYTMNTAQWHRFASNQSEYVSPGVVLVYDTPGTDQGYKYNPDCSFGPLTFGGMWVKTLAINGLPFSILGTGSRSTEFGATGASTLFKFDASYTIDRSGTTTFYGDATVEIAQGATFTAQARSGYNVAVDSSATLKLQGAGTLAVTTMNVAGTLDLSATTVPSISGNVALAGNSTLVLPAGTALDDTISLEVCSGTLSAAGVVYVKVGDEEAEEAALTIDGGSITQITTSIQTEQTFTSEPYPDVVPVGYTYTYVGTDAVTIPAVTVNGTLKTSGPITITDLDVANGADFEVVAGNTTVGCSADCKLKGNIKVDAGATLTNTRTDSLSYNHAMTVDIYGTLAMGATRWSIPANCTFKLHAGAQVTGPGDAHGSLDFINGVSKGLDVYAGEASSARIEGKVRVRANESRIWIGDNTTLVLESGIADGGGHHAGFKQVGPGTLEIHANSTGLSGNASVMTQGTLRIVDTTLAFPVALQGASSYLEVVATEAATTVPINVTSIANNNVTFSGAGKVNGSITKTSAPGGNLATALQSSAWTGTFVADWEGNKDTRFDINSYGNSDSVVEVTKLAGGYVGDASTTTFNVLPTVKVSGTMKLDNGFSGKITSFARLTGSGTFTQGGVFAIDIAVLDGFTGTIVGEAGGGTSIGTINLATAPSVGDKLVTISPSGEILYGFESTKVSVNGVVDETIRLETKSGGIYVKTPVALITSADGQTATPYYDSIATAFASVAEGETLTLVGSAVTLSDDVTVSASYTLAGDAEGTTVTGAGKIYLTGTAELTLDATLTSVGNQFWFSSHDAKLTFPTGKSVNVRPYTAGGCQTGTIDNGDGTTTYYQYVLLQLQVGASNVTLAYYGSGDPLVTKQINEGDIIVFTATPAEGYENPVVTVNGTPLAPEDGKYTVVVGTVNVSISATASAASSDTYEVSGETEIGEGGSFTVPEGTTKVKVGGYTLEDGGGISINGTTVTVLAPAVVEEAEKEAIVIDDDKDEVTLNVDLVPGLYYGVGVATSLEGGINRPVTLQQYTGDNDEDILTVTKPEGVKGFFKVFVDIKQ